MPFFAFLKFTDFQFHYTFLIEKKQYGKGHFSPKIALCADNLDFAENTGIYGCLSKLL